MNQNNDEISQDFDNLVGNKGGSGAADSDNGAMNEQKMLQQRMMQQQAMQQQAMQQQQAARQQAAARQPEPQSEEGKSPAKVEGFMNKFNTKTLSLLGVLFALFYVFSSSQLENVVKNVPYLSNQQFNLLARGLLFAVTYFILDKFVL